ncbi:hypothetical protein ACL6C3_05590 [Capilliphycus salinus ALCB114379]|uniref:hypothetical protein n=1 Tax=Capilliphycus salinus TaxID=2768948 RepID=UPI0039A5196A
MATSTIQFLTVRLSLAGDRPSGGCGWPEVSAYGGDLLKCVCNSANPLRWVALG